MYKTSLILTSSSSCASRRQFLVSPLPCVASLSRSFSEEGCEELSPASAGRVRRNQNQLLSLVSGQIIDFQAIK